jgi:site-specific DNA recombinase
MGKPKSAPNDAVGYIRVSTTRQADEGQSLPAQRQRIEAHCAARGLTLLRVHADEGVSGKKASNRAGLQRALRLACRRKAALVACSLSRVARSVRDAVGIAEQLQKADADIVLLQESIDTTTPGGRLMFNVMASIAQFEAEITGERTKAVLAHLRAQGRRVSRFAPYGFDLSGSESKNLLPNKVEQDAIVLMLRLRGEGLGLRRICQWLEADGIRPKRSTRWSPAVVSRIITRESDGTQQTM